MKTELVNFFDVAKKCRKGLHVRAAKRREEETGGPEQYDVVFADGGEEVCRRVALDVDDGAAVGGEDTRLGDDLRVEGGVEQSEGASCGIPGHDDDARRPGEEGVDFVWLDIVDSRGAVRAEGWGRRGGGWTGVLGGFVCLACGGRCLSLTFGP